MGESDNWDDWQCIDVQLVAPAKGMYEWNVMLMSDTWVGCNSNVRFKFSVNKASGESASRNFVKSPASATHEQAVLELDSDLDSNADDDDDDDKSSDDGHDDFSSVSGTESEEEDDDNDDDDLVTKDE